MTQNSINVLISLIILISFVCFILSITYIVQSTFVKKKLVHIDTAIGYSLAVNDVQSSDHPRFSVLMPICPEAINGNFPLISSSETAFVDKQFDIQIIMGDDEKNMTWEEFRQRIFTK